MIMVVKRSGLQCRAAVLLTVLLVLCWPAVLGKKTEVRVSEKRGQILPNGVIQYMDMDHDGCEKACASEIKIVCNYFKFDKATKNCYLSATINPGGNRTANGQGGLMSDLSAKVDELQSKATDMEDMKGTLSEMRQELNLLKRRHKADVERQKESKQQEDNVVDDLATKMKTLSAEGEKFKAALHALSNMQRALAKEIGTLKDEDKTTTMKINELQKSSQYLETLTNSLGATDSTLQRELDAVKDTMNDIATKLNKLHAHLDKPSTPDRLTPAIVKLKRNQGALATALESMSDKVSSLVARMPFMEKEVRSTNQKVSNEAVFAQELQGKLKVLYKNVVELKKAIHQLEDPRSAINMQRSKGVMKLKSDVSMLAQVDKTLQNELKDQKEDVANLVRDVAKVQLQAQNLQDKLSLVLTASRQFESEIAVLKKAQKSGMSVVEVAQMQKQVVVALTRLKTRETILMKQLDKYRESVRDIAEKVSAMTDAKADVHKMVIQLKHNLKKFGEQIKALYARTKTLDAQIKDEQSNQKNTDDILKEHEKTNARVEDLVNQLKIIESKIAALGENVRRDEIKQQTKDKTAKHNKKKQEVQMKVDKGGGKVAVKESKVGKARGEKIKVKTTMAGKNKKGRGKGKWKGKKGNEKMKAKKKGRGKKNEEVKVQKKVGNSKITIEDKGAKDKKGGTEKGDKGDQKPVAETQINIVAGPPANNAGPPANNAGPPANNENKGNASTPAQGVKVNIEASGKRKRKRSYTLR